MKPIITDRYRNNLEHNYAGLLNLQKHAGEILDYKYESIKFVLGDNTTYLPDFFVIYHDHFEIHETKGHKRQAGMVKFKTAVRLFPWFKFKMIFWENKRWVIKEY